MSYVTQQTDKIISILENNGCSLYPPDVKLIGNIIAEAVIAANLEASLVEEAVTFIEDNV